MPGDATPHRSEGRFYIKSDATRVTVTFTDSAGEACQFVGKLVDLSTRGVRIDINGRIEPEQEVDLKIEVPSQSITMHRTGVIRWQQPRTAKIWWTGCELSQPFEQSAIEELATARVLNRRRDPRYSVDKPVQVRAELSHKTLDARLVNYSKGGFCLLFNDPIDFAHERLMLIVNIGDEDVTIPARVMWTGGRQHEYGVGCAFTNVDGFLHLREYAEPLRKRRPIRFIRRHTVSSWVALSMILTIALQTSWLIRSRPELAAVVQSGWSNWVVAPIRERFLSPELDGEDTDVGRAG